jgi:hypothetical protein
VHTALQRPFFPHDYPDTAAAASLAQQLHGEQQAAAQRRPAGRAPKAPALPSIDWRALRAPNAAGHAGSSGGGQAGWHVARSADAVLRALPKAGPAPAAAAAAPGSGGQLLRSSAAKAVARGQLVWRPKQQQPGRDTATAAGAPACLVRVAVRILGKGRCEEGAQVCLPGGQVMGHITSASARGSSCYPGGVGFCSLEALWRLHCQQGGRAGRGGGGGGGGWVVRAGVLNPGSDAQRAAEVRVVVEEEV